jgi:glucose/arabinose dehydrogenase
MSLRAIVRTPVVARASAVAAAAVAAALTLTLAGPFSKAAAQIPDPQAPAPQTPDLPRPDPMAPNPVAQDPLRPLPTDPRTPDPEDLDPTEIIAFHARTPAVSVECDVDNGGLTLPSGFCALVVAENIGRARHLVVRRNGDIYVALNPARDGSDPGGLLALRDADNDGRAEVIERLSEIGGNGLELSRNERFLYFAQNDRVLRYALSPTELRPTGAPVTIVSGMPATGDHASKTVVLDRSGGLFVNVGSATNSCQVENRAVLSPGIDPCVELETRAGIWRFRADRQNQVFSERQRFATGLRNTVALAVHPLTQGLWGIPNGRDQLFESWPNLFTALDDEQAPAEELVRIRRGMDNGWPYCYEDARITTPGRKVLAPEYGGDGQERGRCAAIADSALLLPAHWAPLAMLFYTGRQFPRGYALDAFVTSHGARFPGPPEGPGYQVLRVRFSNGRPVDWETFADGFASGAAQLPQDARDRPVGLAVGPDGSLYISSDQPPGRIFRVVFRPQP